jgi:hypothetical protein
MAVTVESPKRVAPKRIVLRLRHPDGKPIQSATINGRKHREFDARRECVTITPGAATSIVRVDY